MAGRQLAVYSRRAQTGIYRSRSRRRLWLGGSWWYIAGALQRSAQEEGEEEDCRKLRNLTTTTQSGGEIQTATAHSHLAVSPHPALPSSTSAAVAASSRGANLGHHQTRHFLCGLKVKIFPAFHSSLKRARIRPCQAKALTSTIPCAMPFHCLPTAYSSGLASCQAGHPRVYGL